jgi:hypothetical protein
LYFRAPQATQFELGRHNAAGTGTLKVLSQDQKARDSTALFASVPPRSPQGPAFHGRSLRVEAREGVGKRKTPAPLQEAGVLRWCARRDSNP